MSRFYAVRLTAGQDLKQELLNLARAHHLSAAVVVSAVGELKRLSVRLAGARPGHNPVLELDDDFEIVSMTGTLSGSDAHLHLAVSKSDGSVIGGHLKPGCRVGVTAEIVLLADPAMSFQRQPDQSTGYDELTIMEADHGRDQTAR